MTTQTQRTDPTETSVLAMAKAGNQAAIDQLVTQYWSDAYRVAARILRSHEDAEETAQDTLWAAIKHLSTFREDASFRTWLHRIAVNHSLMALRRKQSRTLGSLCPLLVGTPPSCIKGPRTPEELLLEAECRSVIDEGISRLPALYSVALQLADREGRSTNEIAACMGISGGAVKTRLHRGRAHLRHDVLHRLCVKDGPKLEPRKGLRPYRAETGSRIAA